MTPARTFWRGLLEVLATIPNIRSAQRNNLDIPEEQLPAAVVFDGDEETDDADDMGMRPPQPADRGAHDAANRHRATIRPRLVPT